MKEITRGRRQPEPEASDDIEIIEVVGVRDDTPPPSERDAEEVEVRFDEADTAPAQQPSDGPRETAPPVAVAEEPLRDRLLRLQADFENFKKRIERERDDYYRHVAASLVGKLLPVIDNLERALASESRPGGEEALRRGVALIHRQLVSQLRSEGLEPMSPVGEPFDPVRHEAVATDPASGLPPNTVVEEIQRGYFFKDRVLRPAAVRVSVDGSNVAAGPGGDEET